MSFSGSRISVGTRTATFDTSSCLESGPAGRRRPLARGFKGGLRFNLKPFTDTVCAGAFMGFGREFEDFLLRAFAAAANFFRAASCFAEGFEAFLPEVRLRFAMNRRFQKPGNFATGIFPRKIDRPRHGPEPVLNCTRQHAFGTPRQPNGPRGNNISTRKAVVTGDENFRRQNWTGLFWERAKKSSHDRNSTSQRRTQIPCPL